MNKIAASKYKIVLASAKPGFLKMKLKKINKVAKAVTTKWGITSIVNIAIKKSSPVVS